MNNNRIDTKTDERAGSELDHGTLTNVLVVNEQEQSNITSLCDKSWMDSNCTKNNGNTNKNFTIIITKSRGCRYRIRIRDCRCLGEISDCFWGF